MKQIDVTVNDQTVHIKKMALGRYQELLLAIDNLPEEVAQLDKLSEEAIIGKLPVIMGKAFPQAIKVLSVATGLDEKYLREEIGLDDAAVLVKAVFEVNDFLAVGKTLRSLFKKKEEKVSEAGKNSSETGSTT